ncbi:MAG: sensor domain-containing diguanylate cyclase [Leptospirales bacterium]|nr:sensor domain-containing diguanylate cyclase [Leptospirales bacterium]
MTLSYSLPDEIQHYEKKIYDLRQLLEISRALNSTLDYEYLIQAVLDMCLAQVQTLRAALFLTPDMDADALQLMDGYKGFELNEAPAHYRINLDSPLINYFESNTKSLPLQDALARFEDEAGVRLVREMGGELIVPMRAKGKVIGLIVLGEKVIGGLYPEEERGFLSDLASLAGVAVENARLYERATVDMMTGLKNHAYFQSRFKEEREKAARRGTPLALLLTDVDKFKNFNDTHGHQAGDAVLKEVARNLMSVARKSDFAARYGGEEFCLVLPGADAERAREIAETLRRQVEACTVVHEGKEMRVTLSVGVAIFQTEEDLKTNKRMVERADKALYACKHGGRNQVQVYSPAMG